MGKKKKKINPILDWLSVVVALLVMGYLLYSFYFLFHYERQAPIIKSILTNKPLPSETK